MSVQEFIRGKNSENSHDTLRSALFIQAYDTATEAIDRMDLEETLKRGDRKGASLSGPRYRCKTSPFISYKGNELAIRSRLLGGEKSQRSIQLVAKLEHGAEAVYATLDRYDHTIEYTDPESMTTPADFEEADQELVLAIANIAVALGDPALIGAVSRS